jgi:hypothetical protein
MWRRAARCAQIMRLGVGEWLFRRRTCVGGARVEMPCTLEKGEELNVGQRCGGGC